MQTDNHSQRRYEDNVLLDLKVGGTLSLGVDAASGSWDKQEIRLFPRLCKQCSLVDTWILAQ